MSLLLWWRGPDPRQIEAGTATVSLSGQTAAMTRPRTISAGTGVVALAPDGADVAVTTTVTPSWPTADELLTEALPLSHAPRSRVVTLYSTGAERTRYNPAAIVLSGTITYDRSRAVRRFGSLVLVDEDGDLAPQQAGDEFAAGERMRVDRGVRVSQQNIYQTLGAFEVSRFSSSSNGSLGLTIEDTSYALRQDFGEVVTLPAGTRASEALETLWEPVLGAGSWDMDDDGMGLDAVRSFAEDDDRLSATVALMRDLGLEVYMSRAGTPMLRPVSDPNDATPSHTWEQGLGTSIADTISRAGDWQPFNRQVVIGEPLDRRPLRAVADITDTTSPLHANRIGLRVAPVYRSAQVTTQHQANTVARDRLMEHALWSDTVIVSAVPDPTVEAGDVVRVVDAQTGTDASYRIDSVTIPVTQGQMSATASLVVPMFAS